jgi:ligand-binding SRPBCC domain-containing protein
LPTIRLETQIHVPIQTCFDLARSIDLHPRTVPKTREQAVEGRTTGLIGAGDTVTFEATHFGIRQRLSSRMTEFDPPYVFADEMTRGAFQSLRHTHAFAALPDGGTLMTDTLEFTSPLGILGRIADRLFLEGYMRRFLLGRNRELKHFAEGGDYTGIL